MSGDQLLILGILLATVAMFLWGRWRHDMVAAAALLTCVATGLVPAADAFSGFGNPAVITVACVLVLSRGLQTSGAVDVMARRLLPANAGPALSIAALTGLGAVLSGFMNNIGALALLMPVALQLAKRHELPPGRVLMPLSFGSILGGMTTLIGTPPNLIVSNFRSQAGGETFGMFDFSPVGVAVAASGVAFITLLGWRLVPARAESGSDTFDPGAYLTEARVRDGSKAAGQSLRALDELAGKDNAQVVGLVRGEVRLTAPNPGRVVRVGDILVLEAEAEALAELLSRLGLELVEAVAKADDNSEAASALDADARGADAEPADAASANAESADTESADAESAVAESADAERTNDEGADTVRDDEPALLELAVLPDSRLLGRSASDLLLRTRYSINLLALSRQGRRTKQRLRAVALQAGDLLLMQGAPASIAEFASNNGCVLLAEREIRIPDRRKALVASAIMGGAILVAAFGLLPAAVGFAAGVLASMVWRTVPPRSAYEAIDWPVIVLLAALIPVAGAMETTGTAALLASLLLDNVAQGSAVLALGLVLLVSMTLSDLVNNAATAAVVCPVALSTARGLDANPDTFLMAVAVGASCAFLTPIGHQNNTLILGPGGFRFGDYWRLGLPVQLLVIAVSIPVLLWAWPL